MDHMKKDITFLVILFGLSIFLFITGCQTQEHDGLSGQGPRPGDGNMIPRITACEGLSIGDNCTAQTARGEMAGTCNEFNATLVCTREHDIPDQA